MTAFPDTLTMPLARPTSDHIPCVVRIGTLIPKSKFFRFENYWLQHSDFMDVVAIAWNIPVGHSDYAKSINAKLKNLRRALKQWARTISCLKRKIENLNEVIFFFDLVEEFRNLSDSEWNCRNLLKEELLILLKNQKIYWK
ncbi:uncharacterized protein [Aegilops tauschii subsp. strangulata]|uniref:uncharacterized protein n=1 Tax=Aegilops tauschii subsp. strangulata TaxID=200361 RepID=UPI003CC89885